MSFLRDLNCFHSSLKFTHEISNEKVNFLDVTVSLENHYFKTDLFCKPTDCHQYLEFTSFHPIHIKRSVVYSQGLTIKRICSSTVKTIEHLGRLRSWFCERGYPEKFVDRQLEKVYNKPREELFRPKEKSENGVPFVTTFSQCIDKLGKVLQRYLPILYSDTAVQQVFFTFSICLIS